MASLSTEIWHTIIKYLRLDQKSLKSVRIVCRGLHDLATPLLFSTVRVFPGDNQNDFVALSETPNLASVVRRIEFHDEAVKPQLHGFRSHYTTTFQTTTFGALNILIYTFTKVFHDHTDIQERPNDRSWGGQGVIKQKLLQWHSDPARIANYIEFKLTNGIDINLAAFSNLECVETSKAIFLQGQRFSSINLPNTLVRRNINTWRSLNNTDLDFVRCAAIMSAWVTRIELTDLCEIIDCDQQESDLLPNLAHLKLDLFGKHFWPFGQVDAGENILANWLQDLIGLQSLVIRQNPSLSPGIDLLAMLGTSRCQELHTIELDQVTTHGSSVRKIVHEHLNSLRFISIVDPIMEESDWKMAQNWLSEHGYHGYDLYMSRESFRGCLGVGRLLVPHTDALPTIG